MKLCKLPERRIALVIGLLIAFVLICITGINKITLSGPAYSIYENCTCGKMEITLWEINLGLFERIIKSKISLPCLAGFGTEQYEVSGILVHSINNKKIIEIGLACLDTQNNSMQFCSVYYFPKENVAYLPFSSQAIIAPASSKKDATTAINKVGLDIAMFP